MRILFCWPSADLSVFDVARGYRGALERDGHAVKDYRLSVRIPMMGAALKSQRDYPGWPDAPDLDLVCRMASEGIVAEALYHRADVVFLISGLNFHGAALWLLREAKIPTAVLFTESPYDDEPQERFTLAYPEMAVMTNDRASADRFGWTYIRHAYDPAVHAPAEPLPDLDADVLLIGTGWIERQRMLEAIDWTGIKLTLLGLWPNVTPESPIAPFVEQRCIDNAEIARYYASTKIVLNFHRGAAGAYSVNPRVIEATACGAFLATDYRPELRDLFGQHEPCLGVYTDAESLEREIRWALAHDEARRWRAAIARECVRAETFDDRLPAVLAVLDSAQRARASLALT